MQRIMTDTSYIPNGAWPRGMHEAMAAAYVGLSATQFRIVARDYPIEQTWLTKGRKVYLLENLDRYLDAKAGLPSISGPKSWAQADEARNALS
jgi:hypothetical protein